MIKFLKALSLTFILLFSLISVVKAVDCTGSICLKAKTISTWVNFQPLYISYTALESGGNPIEVKGYIKKEGEAWQEVGTSNELADTFEVSRNYYPGDGIYKVYFREVNNGVSTAEEEFNVDFTAPGSVSNYSKERKSANVYKICWKNPNDDDVNRVIIFRSEKTDEGFSKVVEVSGSKDEEKCHENGTPDNKDYYYALRVIDHAGNASGAVGDGEINTTGIVLGSSTIPTVTPEVVVLPLAATGDQDSQKEVKEGEIAGGGADEMQEEATGAFGEFGKAVGQQVARFNYWQIAGIVIVIAGIIVLIIYLLKKEKK